MITVLAQASSDCLASETWSSARVPSLRRPFDTRYSAILEYDEPASRMKKRACFASVKCYVLGCRRPMGSMLSLPWEVSHHLKYVVAGLWVVRTEFAFVDPSPAENPSNVVSSTSSHSRTGQTLRIGTSHAADGILASPQCHPFPGLSCVLFRGGL